MFEQWICTDLNSMPSVKQLKVTFSQDDTANRIGAEVTRNGEPVAIDGTISANIIRADGVTVYATGQSEGNRAWVDLPSAAYLVPGRLCVILKMTTADKTVTLGAIETKVYKSRTGVVV